MAKQPIEGTRSNMFWRSPDSLTILGYDEHAASPLLAALGQNERPLGEVCTLREIAEAWNEGDEEKARGIAVDNGGQWLVEDACLALNIASSRIHEPVLVTRDGDDVIVVDGRRRVVAARVADVMRRAQGGQGVEVPVIVVKGAPGALAGIMGACNELRRANSPLARAEVAYRIASQVGGSNGDAIAQVALSMGVTTQTARSWIALGELPADLRSRIGQGKLTMTKAASVAKKAKLTLAQKVARLTALADAERVRRKHGPSLKARVARLLLTLDAATRAALPAQARKALDALEH